ncbi:MAG TPA: cell division protein FtsQ, partial [Tenuifilaceae bacterium]|nr:cell division protein FtsQ [Tenuifilaceae bacterium]
SQLYVNNSNNIELVPTVGPHIVLLGNLVNFKNKLAKLELLYKKALPVEGWNKYSVINLKYSNQIVCTKR